MTHPTQTPEQARTPPRRVHVFVAGRVQGVWFRDSTRHEALRLGVRGWVRNTHDGRVEAVFEGETGAVSALLDWAHHGPEHAVVTDVQTIEEAPREERGFHIVP